MLECYHNSLSLKAKNYLRIFFNLASKMALAFKASVDSVSLIKFWFHKGRLLIDTFLVALYYLLSICISNF
jgi:hypothetical protein